MHKKVLRIKCRLVDRYENGLIIEIPAKEVDFASVIQAVEELDLSQEEKRLVHYHLEPMIEKVSDTLDMLALIDHA